MQNQSLNKKFLVGGLILLVGVGSVIGFRYFKKVMREKNPAQTASTANLMHAKTLGPDTAPIKILDFSDFQCPACGTAVPILEKIMEKYPGKIQLTFKHFPLRMHVWAAVAHQSAECSARQGKFWDFYKLMYKNQSVWSILSDPMVTFAMYATEIGLNMDEFSKCMVDTTVAESIAAEKKEGETLEISSTPTFFVNGKMFAGPMELQNAGQELIRKTLGLSSETQENTNFSEQASLKPTEPAAAT